MAKDDVVIINQPGNLEQRTSRSGKVRYTLAVKSDPVVFNLNDREIARPLTEAIIHHLKSSVKAISEQASPATIEARKVAAKAYAAGKPWALRQFSGGKTGATPPDASSTRAFNFSGRFVNSIVGNFSKDGVWRINVAANRLNPQFGDVTRIWNRLVQLVPEFGDPSLLLRNDFIKRKAEEAANNIRKKASATKVDLAISLAEKFFRVAGQLGDVIAA